MAACCTSAWQPERPPLDARWVGSLYLGIVGSTDVYLARIRDLVDSGQIRVIARSVRSTVEFSGGGPQPALFLTGKPDAVALAQERIADRENPDGPLPCYIGIALVIPDHEPRQAAEPMLSVLLLPQVDSLHAVLTLIREARESNCFGAYREFIPGTVSATDLQTLLVVEAGCKELDLLTRALHSNGVPYSGFLHCRFVPLYSAPF